MVKVFEQRFHLTDADSAITAADGTADAWSDIFSWQCPQGVTLLLKSTDTFSAYIDATGEIGAPNAEIKLEWRDASEQDKRPILGPAMYVRVTEFQDEDLKAHLNVPSEGLLVQPRQRLVIMVKDDGTVLETNSYFDLFTTRIRESVV